MPPIYLVPSRAAEYCAPAHLIAMLRTRFAPLVPALDERGGVVLRDAAGELLCTLDVGNCPLLDPAFLDAELVLAQQQQATRRTIQLEQLRVLAPEPVVRIRYELRHAGEGDAVVRHLQNIFEAYLLDDATFPDFMKK